MSGYLWKSYLEDDAVSFRQILQTAAYTARVGTQKSHAGGQITGSGGSGGLGLGFGSPGNFGTSPGPPSSRTRKGHEPAPAVAPGSNLTLTRSDINHRDLQGRTLLHLAASSASENAFEFATALLEHPLTDIYLQDAENGWTALHRAFYAGNLSIAHAILSRDSQDAFGHGTGTLHHQAGGLIRIKDQEGNGPFDLFEMTFLETEGVLPTGRVYDESSDSDDDSVPDERTYSGDVDKTAGLQVFEGDEVFTFGSNRNVTLGFGDEDDRQFPERISLRRPDHLFYRFHRDHVRAQASVTSMDASTGSISRTKIPKPRSTKELPAVVRNRPIRMQNVHMAKYHTAILTSDPESNLYICGHGAGGRLGTGDELTRFQFVCIESGALARKKIVTVALGQNHTLALSDEGETFSWGNNGFGQLGYALPQVSKTEDSVQTLPRQIYGPLKREYVIGVAASRLHSVAHTSTSLYTFGKNEGQLGLVDSDARSLEIQDTPRKVAASLFSSLIASVSAIDRATTVLLENHEVWVFANYGYAKIQFPLDGFTNYFLQQSFRATKYESVPNTICKVVASGDTICAMSTSGDVFTVAVSQPTAAAQGSTGSTTNPTKIRSALSQPQRIWSNKKTHMAAVDVDVDQNGAVILATQTGSVWRRVKRAKIKDASAAGSAAYKPKDYKFSRVSGLTRVVAVRASGFGAYAAIREDCTKTRSDIEVSPKTLWENLLHLSPFEFAGTGLPKTRSALFGADTFLLKEKLGDSSGANVTVESMIQKLILPEPRIGLPYDLRLSAAGSDVRIPIHSFLLGARSKIIRHGLEAFVKYGSCSVTDVFSIKRGEDGFLQVSFESVDILTVFYLVLYLYTEEAVRYGQMPVLPLPSKNSVANLATHRLSQRDLVKLAARLDMSHLASAIERSMNNRTLHRDMEESLKDPSFFANADVIVQLEDDEVPVHGPLVCQRCPFFEGLFKGRTGGKWLAERREGLAKATDAVRIDLSHVNSKVFAKILRFLYADTGIELFNDEHADNLDDFLDFIIEVMGVANELLLDRLCEICQNVIGQYVTVRNVCQLVNAVAPCSVDVFKKRAMEYICINLEACLQNGLLDELDEDLFLELDEVGRQMQSNCSLLARSGALESGLLERYPGLQKRLEQERQAKIDSIVLLNKYADTDSRVSSSFKAGSFHEFSDVPSSLPKTRRRTSRDAQGTASPSPCATPTLSAKRSTGDLLFEMDHEDDSDGFVPVTPSKASRPNSTRHSSERRPSVKSPDLEPGNSLTSIPSLKLGSTPDIHHNKTQHNEPARSPKTPWSTSGPSSDKLDMKSIMEQASSSRTSTLSAGLAARPNADTRGTGPITIKMSQKERKRQQAQLASPTASVLDGTSPASSKPSNPWQVMTKGKTLSPGGEELAAMPLSSSSSRTPHLTMRQTVANPGPSLKGDAVETSTSPANVRRASSGQAAPTAPPSHPQRSTSHTPSKTTSSKLTSPTSPTLPASHPASTQSQQQPPPPVIRSIRHTPLPQKASALSGLFSMADILSEQQAEKQSIIDYANEKRSLADIQTEQEFQEWWEKESKRIQGVTEEDEDAAKEKRGGRRGSRGVVSKGGEKDGGAPGGRRRGPGKAKEKERDAKGSERSKEGDAMKSHGPPGAAKGKARETPRGRGHREGGQPSARAATETRRETNT